MKPPGQEKLVADQKFWLCNIAIAASLFCVILLFSSSFYAQQYSQKISGLRMNFQNLEIDNCKNKCRTSGTHALPEGIITNTSNFEMRSLWQPKNAKDHLTIDVKQKEKTNLFAMAVGINQKDLVNKMVQKFLASDFVVMLFHYDGNVDPWKEFEWNDRVIHVSVANQSGLPNGSYTPDIVAEYGYIFLWDEDLGVDNFHPDNYVSIIKSEGLEISQPALDPKNSEVHHQITARGRRSKVHRRTYKHGKGLVCDENSTSPPCTGWVEMMAPVFSKAAWHCVWYMIQNDLVHAWGLDMQLGYCAQGDRTKNVGVVDAEYIVHYGHPTLGGLDVTQVSSKAKDHRVDVRRLSYNELKVFKKDGKRQLRRINAGLIHFNRLCRNQEILKV